MPENESHDMRIGNKEIYAMILKIEDKIEQSNEVNRKRDETFQKEVRDILTDYVVKIENNNINIKINRWLVGINLTAILAFAWFVIRTFGLRS